MPRPKIKKIKTKKQSKNFLHSKSFLMASFLIVILLGVSVIKEIVRKIEVEREITSLEQEITSLEDSNQELAGLIDYINSSSFQEKEIKTRLNLKEEGENVVFIPESSKSNNYNNYLEQEREEFLKSEEAKNYKKWWNYFFNT